MPWYTQPWSRVENDGVSAMNDAKLLAAVLGKGAWTENAIDLSCRVLASYNFSSLAALSLQELKKAFRNDIHAIRIAAMFEIVRRTKRLAKHRFSKKIETAEGFVSVGILVHNHPSGDCNPSENDKEITKLLSEAGRMLVIEVLDHIIIGKDDYSSLKEKGMMNK